MNKEKLIQAIESYETMHAFSFKRPVQLKPSQMSNALKKIVCDANVSTADIVALMDTTFMGNGKSGYLLTTRYLYSSFQKSRVALDGLVSCEIRKKNRIHLIYQDGTETDFVISIFTEFEDLFRRIIQLQKEEPAAQEKAAQKEEAQKSADWQKVAQEEARQRKILQERKARLKAEQEAAARLKAEQEAAARIKAEQEAAARRRAEQEEATARIKAEQEAAAKRKAEQEAAARRKAEQEKEPQGKEAAERQKRIAALKEQADLIWQDNPGKAVQYLQEAVALGDTSSLCDLAYAYCCGDGTDCDIQKAKQLYRRAAEMGIQRGIDELEFLEECEQKDVEELYDLANDSNADSADAVMYAQMASEKGLADERYIEIQKEWAVYFCEEEWYSDAFPFYRRAAQKGDTDSQYKLGVLYLFEEGWEADEDAAREWFQKAAAGGHAEARSAWEQMDAAQRCIERRETSESVLGSSPHAFLSDAEAAFRRNRYVESYCLCQYINRKGFREKTRAQEIMADMYRTGKGPLPCKWKARSIYEALAKEGSYTAQFELGEIYLEERQYEKAAEQYEKAAEQEFGVAQLRLADMYDEGIGRMKDPAKAAYWYEKAAGQNVRRAQETISRMYKKGIGVPKDKKRAKYWADEAANWKGY